MPFDPKLIPPDDAPMRPDGELDLPADLTALAGQLSADAAFLATCYPAAHGPQVTLAAELVESAERTGKRAGRRTTLLVSAGLASVIAVGLAVSLAALHYAARLTGEGVAESQVDLTGPSARSTISASVPNTNSSRSPITLSLGELSGPEMEALFDLLERDANRGSSVSF
jgi:hypothetical protein